MFTHKATVTLGSTSRTFFGRSPKQALVQAAAYLRNTVNIFTDVDTYGVRLETSRGVEIGHIMGYPFCFSTFRMDCCRQLMDDIELSMGKWGGMRHHSPTIYTDTQY